MESQKRKSVLDYLNLIELKDFIDFAEICPDDFEPIIRSCYDRYLDLDKETLAWVVIVDGLYMWDLMSDYYFSEEPKRSKALYAELFMLENQIPIVLIQESLNFIRKSVTHRQDISLDEEDEKLYFLHRDFCKEISPLKLTKNEAVSRNEAYDTKKHLLHYMYQMIVKTWRDDDNNNPEEKAQGNRMAYSYSDESDGEEEDKIEQPKEKRTAILGKQVVGIAREAASQGREIVEQAIEEFNCALTDAKSAGIKVPGNVETVSNILRNFQRVLDLRDHKKLTLGDDRIDIPSASRL